MVILERSEVHSCCGSHLFFLSEVCFYIELFKNGVPPGIRKPWISLRSRIFRGVNCSSVVLELLRSCSPGRYFRGGCSSGVRSQERTPPVEF
jgi:hypothetical protein